jgi:outer membrane biosynthesis protein TonB
LTKERLIIRQMREAYEGNNAKPLMPMQFAGMIIEGGIVGYDTSTNSGGAGMRIFGIGKQTQWSSDTVTVSLRAVSVNTGKVLLSVTVQKTILSSADSVTALKFFDQATQSFEAEAGLTINEPGTYAVKATVEMAVVELIKEGQRKGVWDFKSSNPVPVVEPIPQPKVVEEKKEEVKVEKKEEVKVEKKEEVKVEEKKDVVVQPQTKSETKTEAAPSAASEVKKEEPKTLFGQRTVKENSFLYGDQTEASTRKWWLAKGTIVEVKQPGIEGWWRVTTADGTNRGGWIQSSKLAN